MKYRISRAADTDLDQMWDYVAKDDLAAADRVEEALHEAMNMLAASPGVGHRRADVSGNYRFWRVFSYLIAYRLEGRTLIVVRVIHGARDLRRIFKR